jgi:hypothetical protein
MVMVSRGYGLYSRIVDVTGWGNYAKVDHSEGKGGERVGAILRFQHGSPHLCR